MLDNARHSEDLNKRFIVLTDLIDHNTESVEKTLVPQLRILSSNRRSDSIICVKELRPSMADIS
jgi:hypothetical protein